MVRGIAPLLALLVLVPVRFAAAQGEAVADVTPRVEVTHEEAPLEARSDADDAHADAPAEPTPVTRRVAVLLLPAGDVEAAITDALTELLIAEVAGRGGAQIVGKEELQALLGRDDAATRDCVASLPCLGQAAVALGVTEVIAGTLGASTTGSRFVLDRIDVRGGELLGRVFREVSGGLDTLLDVLPTSVAELYVERVRPGRLVLLGAPGGAEVRLDGTSLGRVRDGEPFRDEVVVPGAHRLEVLAARMLPWTRALEVEPASTLVLDVTLAPRPEGVAIAPAVWAPALGAMPFFGAAIGLGVSSAASPSPDATMRATFEFYDAREREAVAADVLFALGGAALVGALLALIVPLVTEHDAADAPDDARASEVEAR